MDAGFVPGAVGRDCCSFGKRPYASSNSLLHTNSANVRAFATSDINDPRPELQSQLSFCLFRRFGFFFELVEVRSAQVKLSLCAVKPLGDW
jgi:hypothetical protein